MPADINRAFINDPVGFARQHVIQTIDMETRVKARTVLRYDPALPEFQERYPYESIDARDRVVFADLAPGSAANGCQGAHRLNFSQVHAPGLLPVFWLPYRQNNTRKITLRDKRDPATVRREGDEARAFFTTALNGCTVFIEGTLEEPTVYHLNAGSYAPPGNAADDTQQHDARLQRTAEMERRFDGLRLPSATRQPAKAAGQTPAAAATLHGGRYTTNYFKTDQHAENVEMAYYIAAAAGLLGVPIDQARVVGEVKFNALVFGFRSRDTNQWEFWFQRRGHVTLEDPTNPYNSLKTYVGREVEKFWPGNTHLYVRGPQRMRSVFLMSR